MNNTEIVRGLYTAFAQGNVPAVLSSLASNIEWREADNFPYADRNPYIGVPAIVEGVFMRLGAEWENFTLNPASFHESGDTVFVQGRYTGTLRATGKSVNAQFMHVWTLADGKVTKFQQYTDTLQFAQAATT